MYGSRLACFAIEWLSRFGVRARNTTSFSSLIFASNYPVGKKTYKSLRAYSINPMARLLLVALVATLVVLSVSSLPAAAQRNTVATGKPTISGSRVVNEELTANIDEISDADGLANVSYSYQWVRVDEEAATETDITDATSSTYTTVGNDIGFHIKVRVSFTDDAGNAEELISDQSDMIVAVISFSQDQYTVREDESVKVVLQVTDHRDTGVTSIPNRLMHSYGNSAHYRVTPNLQFPVPQFDSAHLDWEITFRATHDEIYNPDKGNFGIVILKDDFQRTPDTTLPKGFVLGDGDNIDVQIIIAYVNIIDDELDPDANNVNTGQPQISGNAQVGQTLSAEIGTIADDDGVPAESTFRYQWILVDGTDETDIVGATTKTYTIPASSEGKNLKVRVAFSDLIGYEESVTSVATKEVVPESPGAPRNLSANAENTAVELTWEPPITGGTPSGYEYRLSDDDGSTWEAWTDITGSDTNTTAHTVNKLTNDTAYTFEVRAKNSGGYSAESNTVSATPRLPDPPGALQQLQVIAGDEQVALNWEPPSSGGEPEGYEYRQSDDGGTNWSEWIPVPGDGQANSHIVEKLTNNTEYSFEIRAVNAGGSGAANVDASATPVLPDPPGGVLNLTATAGNTEVDLNWSAPTTGGAPTSYQYRHKDTANLAYIDWKEIPGSDGTTTSYTVTGLQNGLGYTFDARGVNRGGNGAGSFDFPTATPLPPLPAAPSNLTATAGNAKVTLEWDAPTSGGDPDEYAYRYSEDGGSSWDLWKTMTGSDANTVSYEVTDLTNGTTYTFEILAGNLTGDGDASNQDSARPVPPLPGTPQNLDATAGDAEASLTWDAPTTGGPVERYQYRYSTDAGTIWTDWQNITDSDSSTVSYTATELTHNVEHTFEVRATNLGGSGQSSNQTTVTPSKPGLKVEIDYSSDDLSLAHAGVGYYPKVVFNFNLPVQAFRGFSRSIKITNGISNRVYKQTSTDEPNDWVLEIFPLSDDDVTVSFVADIACGSGHICSEDGDELTQVPATPYVIEYDSRPRLIGAWISSDPGVDGEYATDDQIEAKVRFDKPVVVKDGSPTLGLSIEGQNRTATWSGGSGTNELAFSYDVTSAEATVSSISIVDDSFKLGDAAIESQKRMAADLDFTGSPYVTKVMLLADHYENGIWTHDDPDEPIQIDVRFSEQVVFSANRGTPTISIVADGTEIEVQYKTGLGRDTLRFEYEVQPTDGSNSDGAINSVSIVPDSLNDNGADIRDWLGNDADLSYGGGGTVWELVPSYGVVTQYRFFDGNEGVGEVIEFEVRLEEPVQRVVKVDYATSDDTATDGVDYTGVSDTLTFEIGSVKEVVTVDIIDDSLQELSETLKLTLSNPVNAAIKDTQTTGWILDDD